MSEDKQLSIIIVNYNSGELLGKCLESLKKIESSVSYEVCIVDNASSDSSIQGLQEQYPELILVKNYENYGFAKGINQGLRETSAPYVLWLNPDAIFLEGDLKGVVDRFESDKTLGIMGPKILNDDGSVQLSCRSFPSYSHYFFGRYSLLTKWFPKNPISQKYLKSDWNHDRECSSDWVSGACFFHRRSLLSEVGWLDEGYFMYFEEVDFCRRAGKAGFKVMYDPVCSFQHAIAGSSQVVPIKTSIVRHQSNWRYYTKFFKRNKLKDIIIATGLIIRCFIHCVASQIKRLRKK